MKRTTLALVSLLALSSCDSSSPAAIAGQWDIDSEAFVETALPIMQEAGRVPAGAEGQARRVLATVRMQLALGVDKSFTCQMGLAGKTDEFTGTWSSTGRFVSLVQSHENGEAKEDTMSGTIRGDTLVLDHHEEGMVMTYPLTRSAAASPR